MRLIALITFLLVWLTPNVTGQSAIRGACRNGGTYPSSCIGGEVVFTGSPYGPQVHVKVSNSDGKAIDDADYTTTGGVLTFTENLSFSDTYSLYIDGQLVLTLSTSGQP